MASDRVPNLSVELGDPMSSWIGKTPVPGALKGEQREPETLLPTFQAFLVWLDLFGTQ